MNTHGIHGTVHKIAIHDDVAFGFSLALAIAARAHMQSVVQIQAVISSWVESDIHMARALLFGCIYSSPSPLISPFSKSKARMPSTWRSVFAHTLHADQKRQS